MIGFVEGGVYLPAPTLTLTLIRRAL